jgi:thioredoxin 1
MQKLSSTQIQEKIQNGETFLLDFYASWCGPCKMLMKILGDAEPNLGVQVYTFDVESDHKFTQDHGVRGVPTLMFIENGTIKRSKSGVMSEASLKEFVS